MYVINQRLPPYRCSVNWPDEIHSDIYTSSETINDVVRGMKISQNFVWKGETPVATKRSREEN